MMKKSVTRIRTIGTLGLAGFLMGGLTGGLTMAPIAHAQAQTQVQADVQSDEGENPLLQMIIDETKSEKRTQNSRPFVVMAISGVGSGFGFTSLRLLSQYRKLAMGPDSQIDLTRADALKPFTKTAEVLAREVPWGDLIRVEYTVGTLGAAEAAVEEMRLSWLAWESEKDRLNKFVPETASEYEQMNRRMVFVEQGRVHAHGDYVAAEKNLVGLRQWVVARDRAGQLRDRPITGAGLKYVGRMHRDFFSGPGTTLEIARFLSSVLSGDPSWKASERVPTVQVRSARLVSATDKPILKSQSHILKSVPKESPAVTARLARLGLAAGAGATVTALILVDEISTARISTAIDKAMENEGQKQNP